MSLELVNTFGTLLTVAIIAATAIAAMVQLRHLRASNQINAMMSIGDRFQGTQFVDALELVNAKLALVMEDPDFRDYVIASRRDPTVPEVGTSYVRVRQAALFIGNTYEELGILVKNGIIDRELFLDRYCGVIVGAWRRLAAFTAFARVVSDDPGIWENFELITVLSEDWLKQYPSTYPKGIRRLQLHNPWPVPPMPATA